MRAPGAAAQIALRLAIDFALPPRCPGCGAVTRQPHSFCITCWSSLTFLGPPCCARCGLPFDHQVGEETECGGCLADPPPFDRMRAAVAYGEISRRVALRLKYGGRPGVAETVARLMVRHLDPASQALIAPVPLHRWRLWKRGYNQAALIAAALARPSRMEVAPDLIERIKATPPMRGMTPRERALSVRGAFRIAARHRSRLRGRAVVLVDDVFTSGATAAACARTLKRAGAARVETICWARVVREGGR